MSNHTNYFAIRTDDLAQVEALFRDHNTPAILYPVPARARDDWQALPPQERWLIVLYPPPWTDDSLLQRATNTLELTVNELTGDWSLRLLHAGQQLAGRFFGAQAHISGQPVTAEITPFSDDERARIAAFFDMDYPQLDAVFAPGRAKDFCLLVGIPYEPGLDQGRYGEGSPEYDYLQNNGFVRYAEEVLGK